ncbi:hypothetical protein LJR153_007256 [Paenibacillus sp. LjRoot153]|uniref:hypothetical protein n=1 Tax=Paenibacillus sp. LjRoot153 TaxID=3342270 RepID=UPI003ED030CF
MYADLGVDILGMFGGSASGDTTEEEYRQFLEKVNQGRITKLTQEQAFSLIQRTISQDVMASYRRCVTAKVDACKVVGPVEDPHGLMIMLPTKQHFICRSSVT